MLWIDTICQDPRNVMHLLSKSSLATFLLTYLESPPKVPSLKREKRLWQDIQGLNLKLVLESRCWPLSPLSRILKEVPHDSPLPTGLHECLDLLLSRMSTSPPIELLQQESLVDAMHLLTCIEIGSTISSQVRSRMASEPLLLKSLSDIILLVSPEKSICLKSSTLRCLINLTGENRETAQCLTNDVIISALLCHSIEFIKSQDSAEEALDVSMLSIGLLVNIVEQCPKVSSHIRNYRNFYYGLTNDRLLRNL